MLGRQQPREAIDLRLVMTAFAAALAACSEDRRQADGGQAAPATPAAVVEVAPPNRMPRPTADPAVAADVVLRHGRIFTSRSRQPWVTAVAVKDGRIVAVGSNGDVNPLIGEKTKVYQLILDFVMPAIVMPKEGAATAAPAANDVAGQVAALSPPAAWEEIEKEVIAGRERGTPLVGAPPADGEAAAAAPSAEATPDAPPAAGGGSGSDVVAGILRQWTIENARAAGRDAELGTLEVGKRADIIVLDQHPYFAIADTIGATKPILVIADGKVILDELSQRKRH
jgi:hypothetical protein